MMYSYNYAALRNFIEDNKLQKKDVLKALGTNDYVTLNKWIEGEVPMHITAMMRFCNYYQWPLENFFLDDDQMLRFNIDNFSEQPKQPLPTGYSPDGPRKAGSGIVETRIDLDQRTPSTPEERRAIQEGNKRRMQYYNGSTSSLPAAPVTPEPAAPATAAPRPESENVILIKLQHMTEVRQLEADYNRQIIELLHEKAEQGERIRRDCQATFDAERNRLMDIIDRLSNENAKLATMPRTSPYIAAVSDDSTNGDDME